MRIGIEAQRIFRAHKHGMDRVALELIRNLQEIDHKNQYFIFVKSDEDTQVLKESSNFKIVEIPESPYPIWEQFKLPKIAEQLGCDILHCTSNTAPIKVDIPLITTVHDIIYLEENAVKQFFTKASLYQKFGNLYRRCVVPKVIDKSKRLITVSEFERTNITNRFGSEVSKKLTAIHNGVSSYFKANNQSKKSNEIRIKYDLPEKYFLFFGSKDPRKNTKRVLQAFSEFDSKNPEFGLVLMNYSETDLDTLLSEINNEQLKHKIKLPGYVDDKDLSVLYAEAELFLFPSLREGFGIPIIEAMASKTPVITSNTSSMPEVAGNAAHLVDPYKVEEIVLGMENVIFDNTYRESLINNGLSQKDNFTWQTMAEKVLKIYNEVYQQIK